MLEIRQLERYNSAFTLLLIQNLDVNPYLFNLNHDCTRKLNELFRDVQVRTKIRSYHLTRKKSLRD